MLIKTRCILIILLLIFLSVTPIMAEIITVEVDGNGINKTEALNNAWKEAVLKASGIFLSNQEIVLDEDLVQNIVTYSRGCVDAYSVLNEENSDSGYSIKIKANIDKEVLAEIRTFGEKKVVKSNEIANISTTLQKHEDASSLIENIITYDDITDFIDYHTYTGFDNFDGENCKLYCCHVMEINDNYKNVFVSQMDKLFTELSVGKANGVLKKTLKKTNWKDYKDKKCYQPVIPLYNAFSGLKQPKLFLFYDDLHFYKYNLKDESLLNVIQDKCKSQTFEVKFKFSATFNGESHDYDSEKQKTSIFFVDGYHNSSKGFGPWFTDNDDICPVFLYKQYISIPKKDLCNLESIKCSYEIIELERN